VKIDGVTESVVKRKRYLIPLVVLAPEFTGAVVVAYLTEGRGGLPPAAVTFDIGDPAPVVGERASIKGSAPPVPAAPGRVLLPGSNAKPI
jgi:hypothetical protein